MSFEQFNLEPKIKIGVDAMGYKTPTAIQQQAIPAIIEGCDVMGIAQTGTGKTAAFVLPILQRLIHGPRKQIRALIIAPTRELTEQTHKNVSQLGKKTGLHSTSIYGGVNIQPQIKRLQRGIEIVSACPGRLLDHLNRKTINLSKVEILVLDEADQMFDMGFLPDIRRILKLVPDRRQTLFFSATMPADVRQLAASILIDPVTVQIGAIAPAKTVSHALYPVPANLKKALLLAMLRQTATGRVLIFTRTKYRARNLARDLVKHGFRAAALQGNMSQNQRQRSIEGFRSGRFDILAATDVAARGIDVAGISHVINFDIPDTVDAYTHRIGRTGRAELSGEAFTLAGEADGQMVGDIEKAVGARIERRRLADFNYGAFVPENAFPRNGSARRGNGASRPRRSRPRSRSGRRPCCPCTSRGVPARWTGSPG